jgi:glyoxylase-like metal-dependent hydrolase (beta-lactamase superfamily II)
MKRAQREREAGVGQEIAPGVFCLAAGKGLTRSNVYFVRSGPAWALVDTASPGCGLAIREAAADLFGAEARPVAIMLTHAHPDHAGSALDLARTWGCPVYVHPDELPFAVATDLAALAGYANPLDRWVIFPLLRAVRPLRVGAMRANARLKEVARAFDPTGSMPGLPDWQAVPTPGHTPGHIAFFRPSDRVLIAGDAVLTIDESLRGILRRRLGRTEPCVATAPWYTIWDRRRAKDSILALARLEPTVLATDHGRPMAGEQAARALRAVADRLGGTAADGHPATQGASTPGGEGRTMP